MDALQLRTQLTSLAISAQAAGRDSLFSALVLVSRLGDTSEFFPKEEEWDWLFEKVDNRSYETASTWLRQQRSVLRATGSPEQIQPLPHPYSRLIG